MAPKLNPLELEVAWSRLLSIVEEADATVMRTAFSSIIRDSHDYSCSIFDSRGNLLVQAAFVTPGHIGGMSAALKTLDQHIPHASLKPGDILITNDPWIMSGHLPDIMVAAPVFHRSRLVAFAACVFHHQDIGGRLGTDNREVYEEGLQLPPCMLYREGVRNEDVFKIIGANVRVPDLVLNDIKSQVTALHAASDGLVAFLAEKKWDSLDAVADEIFDRTEASLRRCIEQIHDGVYTSTYEVEMPDTDQVVRLCATIEVRGSDVFIDFDGTSPQVDLGINSVYNYSLAYCVFALKSITDPFVPNNAGGMRPYHVRIPARSILNCERPAAVLGRTSIGQHIAEVIYSALSQAVPDRLIAQSGSVPLWWLTLSGYHRNGRPFVIGPMFSGGLGARSSSDGVSCLTFPANIRNNPVEMTESDAPFIVERREFVVDSGGPGRTRGGLGQEFTLRVPSGDVGPSKPVVESLLGGRLRYRAGGINGGHAGSLGEVRLNDRAISWGKPYLLHPGDVIAYRTPGGGGYGDPTERAPEAVAGDVREGLVSIEAARDIYRVAIDRRTGAVDEGETRRLRSR